MNVVYANGNASESDSLVLLVNPFYEHFPGKSRLRPYSEPQVGLAYLASSIKNQTPSVRVKIIDQCIENRTDDALYETIKQTRPMVVGFYSSTITIPSVGRLSKRIKSACPETLTILGGPHISALPADLPAAMDVGVIGEGELTLANIVSKCTSGKNWKETEGIVYRNYAELVQSPRRAPIKAVDDIPFPAHEMLLEKKYTYQYPVRARSPYFTSLVASRGCPFHCSFCTKSAVWGDGVRRRSVGNVMAELGEVKKLGFDIFSFRDDTFTHNPNFVAEFCRNMIDKKMHMRWACFGRGDQVDETMAKQLAEAGCFEMHIGVETVNEKILQETGKKMKPARLLEGFGFLKKHGVRAKGTFILGLPGDDEPSIRRTVAFAKKLDPVFCFFSVFVPYPGTVHFDDYKKSGYLVTEDYSRFNYHGAPVISTPELSARQLQTLRAWAYRRFFLRPSKLFQIGADLFREGSVRSMIRAGRSFLNVSR